MIVPYFARRQESHAKHRDPVTARDAEISVFHQAFDVDESDDHTFGVQVTPVHKARAETDNLALVGKLWHDVLLGSLRVCGESERGRHDGHTNIVLLPNKVIDIIHVIDSMRDQTTVDALVSA